MTTLPTRDLAEIRKTIEQRFPAPFPVEQTLEDPVLPTGVARLDGLLPGGGLPRGNLVEISGGPSCGKTGLALAILAAAQRREEEVAFIDPRRVLFGPAAQAAGVDLQRLLVVRPPPAADPTDATAGLRVLDHLLRSRGFSLIVLDLAGEFQRPPLHRLFRVARLAKVGETCVLLLTESAPAQSSLGSPIGLRLAVTRTGFHFTPRAQTPFALGGMRMNVELRKNKLGPPGGGVDLDTPAGMAT